MLHCGYSCAPCSWGAGVWHASEMQQTGQIIAIQCLIGGLVALAWMLSSQTAALAALSGFATAVLPTMYLRWRMLQAVRKAAEPRELVGTVYRGQVGKFAMTVMLFALAMARFHDEFIAVMSTYSACLLGHVIGGLLTNHRQTD